MKTIINNSMIFFAIFCNSFSAVAEADKYIVGETRVSLGSNCAPVEILTPNQILMDTESSARQKCDEFRDDEDNELSLLSEKLNIVDVCSGVQVGERVYQYIYQCNKKLNPKFLDDGGSLNLHSSLNAMSLVLSYNQSACLQFKVTGLTHRDDIPLYSLQQLSVYLRVQEKNTNSNEFVTLSPEIISREHYLAIQYKRNAVDIRNSMLKISSINPYESINHAIDFLGSSKNTGYKYSVQIMSGDCLQP
ncbi:MAG: hypothetical protein ACXVCN_19315 [Bdellovibrio sp.]